MSLKRTQNNVNENCRLVDTVLIFCLSLIFLFNKYQIIYYYDFLFPCPCHWNTCSAIGIFIPGILSFPGIFSAGILSAGIFNLFGFIEHNLYIN